MKTRSDKKFGIKVWVADENKILFRTHCFEHHLPMSKVGRIFITKCLNDYTDSILKKIIKERLGKFLRLNSKEENYSLIGIRVTNDYWQKLGYFAVYFNCSISKIATCLFDFCLDSYEMQKVWVEYGLTFNKKKYRGDRDTMEDRLSDY